MAHTDAALDAPKKTLLLPLLIGLVLMAGLGGGAFYALYSGRLMAGDHGETAVAKQKTTGPAVSFVALDPMLISLSNSRARHLRFSAQLDVVPEYTAEVELLKPRVVDVLNTYLRAVEVAQIEDPSALTRIRGQMLRRVQMVTGEGRVRDLLIIEFVMN